MVSIKNPNSGPISNKLRDIVGTPVKINPINIDDIKLPRDKASHLKMQKSIKKHMFIFNNEYISIKHIVKISLMPIEETDGEELYAVYLVNRNVVKGISASEAMDLLRRISGNDEMNEYNVRRGATVWS